MGGALSGPQLARGTDDTVHFGHTRRDGTLWARRADTAGRLSPPVPVTGRAVAQSTADSDQVGADAVAIGSAVHVLFIEAQTGHLYHTRSDERGSWAPAMVQVDSVDAQWVRGRPISKGMSSPPAYGYVYDAGSNGGSGMNWCGEVPVREQ